MSADRNCTALAALTTTCGLRFAKRMLKSAAWRPLAAFVVALAVYLSTGHKVNSGDAIPSTLTPVLILLHGTLHFDQFVPALKQQWGNQLPYFLTQTSHGMRSIYPVATGLLALPIIGIPILVIAMTQSPTPLQWLGYVHPLGFFAASVITAASVAAFLMVCESLEFALPLSLGLTAFYAFGTEAFSTSSQVLWQQGPGTLFALVTLFCLIRLKEQPGYFWAIAISLAAALDVAVRPSNFLLVGPLLLLAVYKHPKLTAALAIPGTVIGLALIAFNLHYFGNLLGGYNLQLTQGGTSFTTRPYEFAWDLAGMLFSPGRGLFIYFPFATILVVMLLIRPVTFWNPLSAALLFSTLSMLLFYSAFRSWTAGWSVGPRYLTEAQPFVLILVGMHSRSIPKSARQLFNVVCFGVLLPYSIAVQSVLTYSIEPLMWNKDYDGNINAVWYWRDNPIFRGLKQL